MLDVRDSSRQSMGLPDLGIGEISRQYSFERRIGARWASTGLRAWGQRLGGLAEGPGHKAQGPRDPSSRAHGADGPIGSGFTAQAPKAYEPRAHGTRPTHPGLMSPVPPGRQDNRMTSG